MRTTFVHEMFMEIAMREPQRLAIESGSQSMSYGLLARTSGFYAREILRTGTQKGDFVVVLCEDRASAIVCLLAVLRAGCAFVPLGRTLPEERLLEYLKLCGSGVALVQDSLVAQFSDLVAKTGLALTIVPVSAMEESLLDAPWEDEVHSEPDDRCYLFFTSGTTGRPKAIVGRLKAIDHFIRWESKALDITPGTRFSQITSLMFDAVLRDVFVPLCTGGIICIPPSDEVLSDGELLTRWLDETDVNVLHIVPSRFRLIRDFLIERVKKSDHALLSHLRYALLAGEPLLPIDVGKWHSIPGHTAQLVNLYGPSETTMTKFAYFVRRNDQFLRSIPIGRPISGAGALIIDENGEVCARGAVGEIYIRTPYRSLGYLNDEAQTGKSFVPNPLGIDPQDVVYKTGDLGLILEDGNFEILGRRDRQVKIRGVRVELDEIESILSRYAQRAFVEASERQDGDKYLVGYLVNHDPLDLTQIRQDLVNRVPEYLIPNSFVQLQEAPLLENGKVDRMALQRTEQSRSVLLGRTRPCLTEELLGVIFSKFLKRKVVALSDDFFTMGGHSLAATGLVARARSVFGKQVSLRRFFGAPTVQDFARVILEADRLSDSGSSSAGSAEDQEGHEQPFQLGMIENEGGRFNGQSFNRQIRWGVRGMVDRQALESSYHHLIGRHSSLRRATNATGSRSDGAALTSAAKPGLDLFELASMSLNEKSEKLQEIGRRLEECIFDSSAARAANLALISIDPLNHLVILTVDSRVCDSESLGILGKEIWDLYCSAARPGSKPETIFADDLEGNGFNKVNGSSLNKWEVLNTFRAKMFAPSELKWDQFDIAPEIFEAVFAIAQQECVTMMMLLVSVTAFGAAQALGLEELVVTTEIDPAFRSSVEDEVGLYSRAIDIDFDFTSDIPFRGLLITTRNQILHADIRYKSCLLTTPDEYETSGGIAAYPRLYVCWLSHELLDRDLLDARVMEFDLIRNLQGVSCFLLFRPHGAGVSGTLIRREADSKTERLRVLSQSVPNLLSMLVAAPENKDRPMSAVFRQR
ncbi:MAG: amino acid adenylation domain-containing protein [Acidobacteria bacterium]|nr:amino acid adenylation domain-containing protein [Acidobacteriota bacterium]